MNEHVGRDLSAYLDEELAPAERARVAAHLEGCPMCSARLAELRATATLIAALPQARPARSLVPSVAPRFNWLRPVRSLSSVASGAFLFVFLVSAVAQSGSDLGGGPTTPFSRFTPGAGAAPAAAPAAPAATEEKAAATPGTKGFVPVTSADTSTQFALATPSASPVAAPAARVTTAAPAPTGVPATLAAQATAAADRQRTDAAPTTASGEAELASRSARGIDAPQPISPFVWLSLAIVAAIVAFAAHRRLRAA